jgi:hypothetical protein
VRVSSEFLQINAVSCKGETTKGYPVDVTSRAHAGTQATTR